MESTQITQGRILNHSLALLYTDNYMEMMHQEINTILDEIKNYYSEINKSEAEFHQISEMLYGGVNNRHEQFRDYFRIKIEAITAASTIAKMKSLLMEILDKLNQTESSVRSFIQEIRALAIETGA